MSVPCPECKKALQPDERGARLYCTTDWCPALGMETPVWRALKTSGLDAPTPAGLPRPEHKGRPIPWVTACSADEVWWRALDAQRLALAQNTWLCQGCGLTLPDEAWVLATPEGQVLQAALHEACRDQALKSCPHLSGATTRATPHLTTRDRLTTDGQPLDRAAPSDPDFLHQWWLKATEQDA
ncbi:hypothetical protein ABZW47_31635 [Streptomyces sp. NPDC004549]|uniref:hypothetical protein n=1 Tax=Streptomyces sp. NPDC004549 TaxID=3154283 RepID=UPI0033AD5D00